MKKGRYIVVSTLKGILSTGRIKLLFKPNFILFDLQQKNLVINNTKNSPIPIRKVLGIDLIYHSYCADLDIETTGGIISVKSLDIGRAQHMRDILNIHIWKALHGNS